MHTALSLSLSSAMIHITSQSANWAILDLVLYSIVPVSGGSIDNTDNKLIYKTTVRLIRRTSSVCLVVLICTTRARGTRILCVSRTCGNNLGNVLQTKILMLLTVSISSFKSSTP